MEYLGQSICDVECKLLCIVSGVSLLICGTVIGLLIR